jgi:hypothetical protein
LAGGKEEKGRPRGRSRDIVDVCLEEGIKEGPMPITHHVDRERNILFVTRSGAIDVREEQQAFRERGKDPLVVPGIPVLADCTEVNPPDTPAVIKYLGYLTSVIAKRSKRGPLAIVVGTDVEYGMARMYLGLTEWQSPDTEIFRSADEALEWLKRAAGKQ